jgi:twitching motility two-component system response regulator PilG
MALELPRHSVLLVDGYGDTRRLYALVLAAMGSTIVEAEDGAEALGLATCRPPDVAVIDTNLRRIDGFALCALLRREPRTASTAIVLVTSNSSAPSIARAVEAGADEVVIKPFPPNTLLSAIDSAWERRRARQTVPAHAASRTGATP